ncbi:hypothetical protein [Methylobacterium nigriterrae]|uniref:hypothetical protein n=1 Tax=Methylobacterium nigriterrae TaxID=3127512 RepID=UPI0030140C57
MSGCSVLFKGPAQYASLPRGAQPGTILLSHRAVGHRAGRAVPAPLWEPSSGIDPIAALRRSEIARAGWERQRPADLSEASMLASRFRKAAGDPRPDGAPFPERAPEPDGDPRERDRDARMSQLLRAGIDAARPVCVGC